jgi:adenylylsulfate kinase
MSSNEQKHIYAHEHPDTDRRREGGFTLWFTGLSGSGKTTIAHIVGPAIEERGPILEYLDGDTVRTHLSKGLGFSKEDRDANVERIGWVASRLTRHGAAVIASAISPYAEARAHARAMVEEFGTFVEIFVDVSLEEAARRDTKGLYDKALKGELQNFTGVNDPYERPERPDIQIDSDNESAEESARRIISYLEEKNLIPAAVRA